MDSVTKFRQFSRQTLEAPFQEVHLTPTQGFERLWCQKLFELIESSKQVGNMSCFENALQETLYIYNYIYYMSYISICIYKGSFICFYCVLWPYCLLTLVHVFFRGLGSLPSGKKQSLSVQAIGAWGLRSSCETIIWLEQLEQATLNSLNSTWMICWYLNSKTCNTTVPKNTRHQ